MKAAIVEQGQDVGMLKGGNLAGLALKALQVDLAISGGYAGRSSQDVQKVGCCCIRACKKDRSSPGLSHELFQAIVSHGGPYQLVKGCIFNHLLLPCKDIDIYRCICIAKSERKLHNIEVIMMKCRGFGKSKYVMIWLRMGYGFSLEVEIIFPAPIKVVKHMQA